MDEMETLMPEEEKEEMVELMEKRSGLTLPTPNVEDTGMLMGMGKRASGTKEFVLGGVLSRAGKTQERSPWQFCGRLFKICPWPELLADLPARFAS